MFRWLENRRGVTGLVVGASLWLLSAGALALSMQANLAASVQGQMHDFGGGELLVRHLHGAAVLWSLGFTALQLTSLVVIAFVLRAAYRFRTAACFIGGAGFVMLGDVLGLLGLLVWLGATAGAG